MAPGLISRYWHTLRYLKPVQFYGRFWFRFYKPKPELEVAPAPRTMPSFWQFPAAREPSLLGPEMFFFLSEEGKLSELAWDGAQRSKLWRYNQHYFDDLNAKDAGLRFEWHAPLMQRWIDDNPPGQGSGWEPYPTSIRIVNWIKWALAGNQLSAQCNNSLAIQARWLSRRLEKHLLGNHLFANAKALVFAGCYFAGPEARRWLKIGFRILQREVPEQILLDGGHFERSTMYHALALEDMLDLLNVLRCFDHSGETKSKYLQSCIHDFMADWPDLIVRMIKWLNVMRHPDGEISFFNDAALSVSPSCDSLLLYAQALGFEFDTTIRGSAYLPVSGYIRLSNSYASLFYDSAPIGPDYLPGHAHADTLSIELSLFGQRVFVNSGTSEYGLGPERHRQRSTSAHNTVEVNGENSSEVWSGFRVARRAYPFNVSMQTYLAYQVADAWHDGYRRLSPSVIVGRRVSLYDKSLEIKDILQGSFKSAVVRYFCHPHVLIEHDEHGQLFLKVAGRQFVHVTFEGARQVHIEEATWHPRFGMVMQNKCLVIEIESSTLITRLDWSRH